MQSRDQGRLASSGDARPTTDDRRPAVEDNQKPGCGLGGFLGLGGGTGTTTRVEPTPGEVARASAFDFGFESRYVAIGPI